MTPPSSTMDVHDLMHAIDCGAKPIVIGMTPMWRFWVRHIPYSYQVWRGDLWETGSSKPLNAEAFSRWANQLGITNSSQVVIWDERYDAHWLWWLFQHYGMRHVCILEGGLQAWRSAGLPLARGRGRRRVERGGSTFIAKSDGQFPIATLKDVIHSETDHDSQLWDTRERDEWLGRKRLHGSRRAGRIAWAKHLPWQLFHNSGVVNESIIRQTIQDYGLNPNKKQIFYCQSGVRTTTAIHALYRLGWDTRRLYNYCGSWREWSHQPQPARKADQFLPWLWKLILKKENHDL